jgi:apolipoprotein N-acyltransferase
VVTRRRDPERWRRRWTSLRGFGGLRILGAAAGGVACYAGYAPSTQWWAPILGFTLLGLAVVGRGWKACAGLGLVFGIALFFPLLSWTNVYVGNVPWVGLAGAEAILTMPGVAMIGPASRRLPFWPLWGAAAWVTGETIRALVPFGGFPWGGVAFTQPDGPLLPIAAVLGEAGLTLAVPLAGLALAELLRQGWRLVRAWDRGLVTGSPSSISHGSSASDGGAGGDSVTRRASSAADGSAVSGGGAGGDSVTGSAAAAVARAARRAVAVLVPAVLVALPFVGALASRPAVQTGAGAPTSPIGVVQGNVPEPGLEFNARRRAVLDMHAAETAALAKAVQAGTVPAPRLVLWPENSSDIDPYANPDAAAVIHKAAQEVGVPILVGAVVGASQPDRVYNMGIVWDPVTGPGATYTKRHPVPFAEYMPWRSCFRVFSDKVDLLQAEFLPGTKPGNLTIAGVPVGDVICFEIVEDGLVRDVVSGGAQVLVVQTNNATFGYTNETYQQQAMSRVRAVEDGREVLIGATSGVSAVIRPDGSVESMVPLFTAGYLVPEGPLITATTPGTVLGAPVLWVLTAACPLVLLGAVLVPWLRRRSAGVRARRVEEGVGRGC